MQRRQGEGDVAKRARQRVESKSDDGGKARREGVHDWRMMATSGARRLGAQDLNVTAACGARCDSVQDVSMTATCGARREGVQDLNVTAAACGPRDRILDAFASGSASCPRARILNAFASGSFKHFVKIVKTNKTTNYRDAISRSKFGGVDSRQASQEAEILTAHSF